MRRRLTGGTHFSERYQREGRRFDSDGCFDSELWLISSLIMLTIFFWSIQTSGGTGTYVRRYEQLLETTTKANETGIFFLETETAAVNPVLAVA